MPAGTILSGGTAQAPPDPPVQMMTATLDAFTHWTFVYQMLAAIEILIVAGLFFVLRPYLPFLISKLWTHLPVVGIMTRIRNIAPFGGFTLRNGMYRREWRNNIMYYVKKYLGSYFFMGVPFDIVHIDRAFVQDPIMNKYLASLAGMGYNDVVAVEEALVFNNIDENGEYTDQIVSGLGFESYEAAKRSINPSNLTSTTTIYAPRYSNIPLDALLPYGADIGPGSVAAQVDDIFEYRKPPIVEDKLMKWMPMIILIMAIGLAGAFILSQVK